MSGTRQTRVYRLRVTKPPKPDTLGWEPEGWDEFAQEMGLVYDDGTPIPFRWPAERRYFTLASAEQRAERFRRWGAAVEVEESEPVLWPAPSREELTEAAGGES